MSHHSHHHAHAGSTNGNADSLVRVVVTNDSGEWVRPGSGDKFYIDEEANFPEVIFEFISTAPPPYEWAWKIEWKAHISGLRERVRTGARLRIFSKTGKFSSSEKQWTANLNSEILGGKLVVTVKAGTNEFQRTVVILGKNPTEEGVRQFLSTIQNVTGFDKLLAQESAFKNFINADNEPVVAGDGGYGMTQLTHPAPTFEQSWNWKQNVRGGTHLYQQKQTAAKNFLGQHGRHYTDEQLSLETISRWNGGPYHEWNEQTQSWQRASNILCDPATGNIGWDTNVPSNANQTVDQLHQRDHGQYPQMQGGQNAEHRWKYSGVCYADHVESHQ